MKARLHKRKCPRKIKIGARQFRKLNDEMIANYLKKEPAFNCADSFKSEALGIALTRRMFGDDPTALIGLPLIRLTQMLERAGIKVL